ncbi:MAG TPA: hypothetical protein VFS04_11160 [Alphaproteobacteria bacterium]|nr:hypothetical protein [Alphaproteobacteria bacterium]
MSGQIRSESVNATIRRGLAERQQNRRFSTIRNKFVTGPRIAKPPPLG